MSLAVVGKLFYLAHQRNWCWCRLAFETVESELRFTLAKAAARQRIARGGSTAAGTAMAAAQTACHSCNRQSGIYRFQKMRRIGRYWKRYWERLGDWDGDWADTDAIQNDRDVSWVLKELGLAALGQVHHAQPGWLHRGNVKDLFLVVKSNPGRYDLKCAGVFGLGATS